MARLATPSSGLKPKLGLFLSVALFQNLLHQKQYSEAVFYGQPCNQTYPLSYKLFLGHLPPISPFTSIQTKSKQP